jgi:hypothetical protein
VGILPMLEAEARERLRKAGEMFGRGKGVEIFPQAIEAAGKARDQAAQSNFAHDKEIIPEHAKGQARDQAAAANCYGVCRRMRASFSVVT